MKTMSLTALRNLIRSGAAELLSEITAAGRAAVLWTRTGKMEVIAIA